MLYAVHNDRRIIFHFILGSVRLSLSLSFSLCVCVRKPSGDLLVWMIKTIKNVEFHENTISFGTLIPIFFHFLFQFPIIFSLYFSFCPALLLAKIVYICIFPMVECVALHKEGKCQIILRICKEAHLLPFNINICLCLDCSPFTR